MVSGLFAGACLLCAGTGYADASFNIMTDGVAALGDSYVEEYAFQPPDKSRAMNFVEILARTRGFDFGSYLGDDDAATRGEPRLAGYEFNWGRDTTRSAGLLSSGQHTGTAAQVAGGQVKLALMFIGGNDFRDVFIADDPLGALQLVVPNTLTNVTTAVQTLQAAHPDLNVVLANVPNLGHLPEVRGAVAQGLVPQQFVDAVTGTIQIYNAQLAAMDAADPRLAVVDAYGLLDELMAPQGFVFNGQPLNRDVPASFVDYDPYHLFVDTIHAGTAGQGLLANEYIGAINSEFGGTIAPLSHAEIASLFPEPSLAGAIVACAATLWSRRPARNSRSSSRA
jgi:hypothetical protein